MEPLLDGVPKIAVDDRLMQPGALSIAGPAAMASSACFARRIRRRDLSHRSRSAAAEMDAGT
jgi:hypothetical protein